MGGGGGGGKGQDLEFEKWCYFFNLLGFELLSQHVLSGMVDLKIIASKKNEAIHLPFSRTNIPSRRSCLYDLALSHLIELCY